jgi:competence protein ComEC
MGAEAAAILCGAYLLGLLLTGISGTVAGMPLGAIVSLISGMAIAFLQRRVWRSHLPASLWLVAGFIGFGAGLYFHLRLPQPSATDLCHFVQSDQVERSVPCSASAMAQSAEVPLRITGQVASAPRLTRSQRLQFELTATQISPAPQPQPNSSAQTLKPTPVSSKVYVTIPPIAGEQLYPGLTITVSGTLYRPKPAANPGGFDFEQYLRQQGIFTGLNGDQVEYPSGPKPSPPLLWSVRQRIVQVQERGLGSPTGALVSAMVMGKGAVQVPELVQTQFKRTGLAHALAASGTQVSLLVGVVMACTQRFSGRLRAGIGLGLIVFYIGLTGIEASVLRAGVMGAFALMALAFDRKLKPLGCLLLAATLLLLYNPVWIFDIGFQLSFLATLGLLVTVPSLTAWFDWMPSTLSPLFTVPIAAYLWTLPLQLHLFGLVSPYSIPVNILAGLLITVISIGGMVSAVAALIHPWLGSTSAWLLSYPAQALLKIAETGSQLPGNRLALGNIAIWQVLLIYGLILIIWRCSKLHRYWWIGLAVGLGTVLLPIGYQTANLTQVTVLATADRPVLVVQDQGHTGLIHSGSIKDIDFTVLPFLQQQGVNQLDWAIAPSLRSSEISAWSQLLTQTPINLFYSSPAEPAVALVSQPRSSDPPSTVYQDLLHQVKAHRGIALPLPLSRPLKLGATTVEYTFTKPDILTLQVQNQTWLWLNGVPALKRQVDLSRRIVPAQVIGWSGKPISPELLSRLHPQVAILYGPSIDPATEQWMQQHQVKIHMLREMGALQWNVQRGFTDQESS